MRRFLLPILSLTLWLVATQHCVVADFLAKHETGHKSESNSHCHQDSAKDKTPAPTNHHKGCSEEGCCQPLIRGQESSSSYSLEYAEVLISFPAALFLSCIDYSSTLAGRRFVLTNAPPILGAHLLASLDLAPNAPPLFS